VWLLQLEVTAVSNACKLGEQIQIAAELELLSMTMHERREHSSGDEIGKKKNQFADSAAASLLELLCLN
jgi:hypothetical protein